MSRLIKLESLLLAAPHSRPNLALAMEVSQDTVRRDIMQLKDLGSDVHYTDNGWYATRPVFVANVKKGKS